MFLSLRTTAGASLTKIWPFLGELGPKTLQKWPNSWMLHRHKNFWKFITSEPHMLWRWNLAWLCIFMRHFIWQKGWAWHKGVGGRGQKTSKKTPKIRFFGSISWNFQDYIKNRNICDTLPCTASLEKVLYKSDLI